MQSLTTRGTQQLSASKSTYPPFQKSHPQFWRLDTLLALITTDATRKLRIEKKLEAFVEKLILIILKPEVKNCEAS